METRCGALAAQEGVPRETAYYRPISLTDRGHAHALRRCLLDKLAEGVVPSTSLGDLGNKEEPWTRSPSCSTPSRGPRLTRSASRSCPWTSRPPTTLSTVTRCGGMCGSVASQTTCSLACRPCSTRTSPLQTLGQRGAAGTDQARAGPVASLRPVPDAILGLPGRAPRTGGGPVKVQDQGRGTQ